MAKRKRLRPVRVDPLQEAVTRIKVLSGLVRPMIGLYGPMKMNYICKSVLVPFKDVANIPGCSFDLDHVVMKRTPCKFMGKRVERIIIGDQQGVLGKTDLHVVGYLHTVEEDDGLFSHDELLLVALMRKLRALKKSELRICDRRFLAYAHGQVRSVSATKLLP